MLPFYILWSSLIAITIGCLLSVRIIKGVARKERQREFKASIEVIEYLQEKIKRNNHG